MNQRIRELAVEAGHIVGELPLNTNEKIQLAGLEKFAELIVRECMLINTQRLFSDYEGDTHRVAHNNALWCAWGDMQEHFGIEE